MTLARTTSGLTRPRVARTTSVRSQGARALLLLRSTSVRSKCLAAALVFVACNTFALSMRADGPLGGSRGRRDWTTPFAPKSQWYGSQILLVDLVGIGAGAALYAIPNDTTKTYGATIAVLTYLVATPFVHVIHDQPRGLIASDVLLRLALPLSTAAIVGRRDQPSTEQYVVAASGIVLASLVDAFLLAWEPKRSSLAMRPLVQWQAAREGQPPSGWTLVVQGTF